MRAPLLIPALVFLTAIVVARGDDALAIATLAAIAAAAVVIGGTPAQFVAAGAVALGLVCGALGGRPPEIAGEIPHALVRGVVVADDPYELRTGDGMRLAFYPRTPVALGERIVAQGRLEPFDDPRNPEEPSPRQFARERGLGGKLVEAQIRSREATPIDLQTLPARLRALANATLHARFGEPDATILAGMLYGARGALPAELRAEFQDTGTVHVLVTAGLHLGVVATFAVFALARVGAGRVGAALAAIPLVWSYAVVSGGHVPSLRAATMVTIALLARALGERSISLNALAAAAIVVGATWPAWVGGASFGLSFSCVGAIVLFAEPISRALERARVPPLFREPLALTLSTQIGVWPLTAATFLVIAPYAALANLLVVPVVGVALIGGIVVLASAPLGVVADVAAGVESWPLAWIESVVHLTARLPFAHVVATPAPPWTLAAYDCAMVAVAALCRFFTRA